MLYKKRKQSNTNRVIAIILSLVEMTVSKNKPVNKRKRFGRK